MILASSCVTETGRCAFTLCGNCNLLIRASLRITAIDLMPSASFFNSYLLVFLVAFLRVFLKSTSYCNLIECRRSLDVSPKSKEDEMFSSYLTRWLARFAMVLVEQKTVNLQLRFGIKSMKDVLFCLSCHLLFLVAIIHHRTLALVDGAFTIVVLSK